MTTQPAVRWFLPEDAEAVVRIHKGNIEWFEEEGISREFVLESAQRSDFRLMVAEEGGEVVGFAGVLFFTAVGRAELGPIGILPEHHNNGVGGLLVESMLEFLKGEGVHRVVVHVKTANVKAAKFFLNCGFTFEANLRRYTKKGEDVVQLVYLFN